MNPEEQLREELLREELEAEAAQQGQAQQQPRAQAPAAELRPYTMLQQSVADSLPQTPVVKTPAKTLNADSGAPLPQQISQQYAADQEQSNTMMLAQQRQADEMAMQERARQYRQRIHERQQTREEYGPARDVAMRAADTLTFGNLPELAHLTTRAIGTPIPASEFRLEMGGMDPRSEFVGDALGLIAGGVGPSALEVASPAIGFGARQVNRGARALGGWADELSLAAREIPPNRISRTLDPERIREAAAQAAPPWPFSREIPVYGQARRYRAAMAGDNSMHAAAAREMSAYDDVIQYVPRNYEDSGVSLGSSELRKLRASAWSEGADSARAREVASDIAGQPITNPEDVHETITSFMERQAQQKLPPDEYAGFRNTDRKYQISEILASQGMGMTGAGGVPARMASRTAQMAAGRVGRIASAPVDYVSNAASRAQQAVERLMDVRPQVFGDFAPTIREAQRRGSLAAQLYQLSTQSQEFRTIMDDIDEANQEE